MRRNETMRQKLSEAFKALNEQNILAKENFTCCTTCASYECGEITKENGHIGFVYWHNQNDPDIERNGEVLLGFSALKDGDDLDLEIGSKVVAAIKEAGLDTNWNGDTSKKICVTERSN